MFSVTGKLSAEEEGEEEEEEAVAPLAAGTCRRAESEFLRAAAAPAFAATCCATEGDPPEKEPGGVRGFPLSPDAGGVVSEVELVESAAEEPMVGPRPRRGA